MMSGRKTMLWWFMVGIFVCCSSGSALAVEWGAKELDTEKVAVKLARELVKGGYQLVTAEELKGWLDKKEEMLLVDTMPLADSYLKNHLPAAVQFEFPVDEVAQLDEQAKADFEKLLGPDKNRRLVFYCGFTKCGRSHNGAMWAMKLGYTNVYRFPGGIKGWLEAGYPVEEGKGK